MLPQLCLGDVPVPSIESTGTSLAVNALIALLRMPGQLMGRPSTCFVIRRLGRLTVKQQHDQLNNMWILAPDKTETALTADQVSDVCEHELHNPIRCWHVKTNCGEGEDVVGVHTLLSGVLQVCHELLVGEEEEKEKEQGRQEEKEVKGEGQSEETAHVNMDHGDGTNGENLSHGACVWMKSR